MGTGIKPIVLACCMQLLMFIVLLECQICLGWSFFFNFLKKKTLNRKRMETTRQRHYSKQWYERNRCRILKEAREARLSAKIRTMIEFGIPLCLAPWISINKKSISLCCSKLHDLVKLWNTMVENQQCVNGDQIIPFKA